MRFRYLLLILMVLFGIFFVEDTVQVLGRIEFYVQCCALALCLIGGELGNQK